MEEWMLYAAMSAVFAALTAVLIKLGVQTIDSDLATFYRTIIIIAMAFVILKIKGKDMSLSGISTKELIFLGLSGIATGLSWFAYFRAMKAGPISKVSLIDKSSVILVVLLGVLFFGEKLTMRGGLGIGLIVGGLYLLTLK